MGAFVYDILDDEFSIPDAEVFGIVEPRGCRTWTRHGEGVPELEGAYQGNVVGGLSASLHRYYEESFDRMPADTVLLKIGKLGEGNLPPEWEIPENFFPIIGRNGWTVGKVSKRNLDASGYGIGDLAPFAISRKPEGGSRTGIFLMQK